MKSDCYFYILYKLLKFRGTQEEKDERNREKNRRQPKKGNKLRSNKIYLHANPVIWLSL